VILKLSAGMIKKILFIFLLISWSQLIFSQEIIQAERSISPLDSIYLTQLPQLKLPEHYKGPNAKLLPYSVNNSELPFFRPVITQGGWECGQSAGVAYTYTYEVNRVRNVSGNLEENQYPTHFTLNFLNGGEYNLGVNYLYSFNLMKFTGSPNVIDYGDFGGSATKWMSGYDKYYNGMQNPVDEMYAIDVSNEEGILTLKHWINDHLDESESGGLAVFYSDTPQETTVTLAPGTPEEGMFVIPAFGYGNGHALTIVGYNDSIRYDFNNDGQYTNHLDINNDDEVNVKDWEIGGIIVVNSFDTSWGNEGFCYSMYKTLAEEKSNGGIWNKNVHVITIVENYVPILSYKVRLKSSARNKIKVTAGIALDTNAILPEHIIEFPIFNYQGGEHFMQGDDSNAEHREIEFALDVTRLLGYVEPDQSARFFLQVHENDPYNSNTGSIEYFSLIDHSWGGTEIINQEAPISIIDNSFTHLFVNHNVSFDKISITTDELAGYEPGQNYTYQLEAVGGSQPYQWKLQNAYTENAISDPYPDIQGNYINFFSNTSGYSIQSMGFSFPFYGDNFNSIRIFVDGFIQLETDVYPFPYQVNDQYIFENQKMLAVYFNNKFQIKPELGNGVWFDSNSEETKIRWKVSYAQGSDDLQFDFSAHLLKDGKIKYYFNDEETIKNIKRVTGISYGDGVTFQNSDLSILYPNKSGTIVDYFPSDFVTQLNMSHDGLLSLVSPEPNRIYQINVQVEDGFRISDKKSLRLSDGIIYDFSVQSGDDDQLDYGETASISLQVKNISNTSLPDIEATIQSEDPYINLIEESTDMGTLNAGQSVTFNNVFTFEVSTDIPNGYIFPLDFSFDSEGETWEGISYLTAYAPELILDKPIILDNDNGKADPGETFDMQINVTNIGHSQIQGLTANYFEDDPFVTINSQPEVLLADIGKHQTVADTLNITIAEDTPIGHKCDFALQLSSASGFQKHLYFSIVVGRIPILIIDMDDAEITNPVLTDLLNQLNYEFSYKKYIPEDMDDYKTAFVLLGRKYVQHELTMDEGQYLAAYLENGGYLYMEGGETWHYDDQTAVHPMFNITTAELSWHYNDTISGITGTFTENMKYNYSSPMPYYGYYFIPGDAAFSILKNNTDPHPMMVAHINNEYRTIASAIDFGALEDGGSPSTKEELLLAILDFFELETNTSIHNFNALDNNIEFNSFPNPFNQNTSFLLKQYHQQSVEIIVYDFNGKMIFTVLEETILQPGEYNFNWEGQSDNGQLMKNGLYFCKLRTGKNLAVIKLIMMR
jgi:hypothetical protein